MVHLLFAVSFAVSIWVETSNASAVPSNHFTVLACHRLPGDHDWPSHAEWTRLNATVGGRLTAGVPLGQVCQTPDYDTDACDQVQEQWTQVPIYFQNPVNVMSPYRQNNSCNPFSLPNSTCILGNIASYAINITGAADAIAGVKFAMKKNIRLSVKNTGHDYIGLSAGRSSLGLWTHNLKSISFFNYSSSVYTGPAVRLGAGVQAIELYGSATEKNLRVTAGYCPTGGVVGGYVQTAGRGPLEGQYGLAADNTLEFEVVTTKGEHLVANPEQNSNLFWALNGGGGGTYAIVISQTTRAHADRPVAGGSLTFNKTDDDTFYSAIEAWQKHLLVFDDIAGWNCERASTTTASASTR
ncbi:FAD-binding domain-containing protein [Aulographum hederae CBS 113979]|uniref:FAD-binding domain-containing protein n=1 Tax=Aulographum hederae CBS 113979 TaxID=1176131 RepID=A0A6G1H1I1_9PEZI|nr:FAD-binding domain-containing protein [Aulographum hederae CBS 113979]